MTTTIEAQISPTDVLTMLVRNATRTGMTALGTRELAMIEVLVGRLNATTWSSASPALRERVEELVERFTRGNRKVLVLFIEPGVYPPRELEIAIRAGSWLGLGIDESIVLEYFESERSRRLN